MKVAVDGSLLQLPARGMAGFTRRLIAPLGRDAVCIVQKKFESRYATHPKVHGRVGNPVWEQLQLPREAANMKADVLLCPYNTGPLSIPSGIRMILVIHDLIFMDPQIDASVSLVQNIGKYYRRLVSPRAAKKAFHIVTVSEYSRKLIMQEFGIPGERITVIPNAVSDSWFHVAERKPSSRPYILTVSGEAPSKNLSRLIEAYARFTDAVEMDLVVVGVKPAAHGYFRSVAEALGKSDHIRFMNYVEDQELQKLYRGAELYVCASRAEGFGIPVLEAMATGTPLACSRSTSLPEVAEDASVYFDPLDTQSITSAMIQVVGHPEDTAKRVRIGEERALRFKEAVIAAEVREFWGRLRKKIEDAPEDAIWED